MATPPKGMGIPWDTLRPFQQSLISMAEGTPRNSDVTITIHHPIRDQDRLSARRDIEKQELWGTW